MAIRNRASLLPVARVAKPARFLTDMREAGYRALALDPRSEHRWDEAVLRQARWKIG